MVLVRYTPMPRRHRPTLDSLPLPKQHSKPHKPSGVCAVIIAAHNAAAWIAPCLRSVRKQRLPRDWELDIRIGVDACQKTAVALNKVGLPYYYATQNVGAYIIRNSLIATEPADVYAVFDADDVMLDGYLDMAIRYAGANGICGMARRTINENGRMLDPNESRYVSGVCTVSAAAWDQLGGYQPDRIASDADLIQRAALLDIPVYRMPRALYLRRRHQHSLTQQSGTRFGSSARQEVIRKHKWLREGGVRTITPATVPMLRYHKGTLIGHSPTTDGQLMDFLNIATVPSVPSRDEESVQGIRHSVYTRLKYDTDDALKQRLALTCAITVPAMVAQRECVLPRWVFLCHDRHAPIIEKALREAGWDGEVGFNNRDDTEDIQTVLDSDDWVSPDWIADVQHELLASTGTEIVYWQPMRYEVATGRWFTPRKVATWCSMFYSVYHPTAEVHAYCRRHTEMQLIGVPISESPRRDMVALCVHGTNIHTKLRGNEVKIDPPHGGRIAPEAKTLTVR